MDTIATVAGTVEEWTGIERITHSTVVLSLQEIGPEYSMVRIQGHGVQWDVQIDSKELSGFVNQAQRALMVSILDRQIERLTSAPD